MAEITNGCHGSTHLAVRIEVLSSGEDPGPIVRGGMFTFGSGQDMVWLRVTFYVAVMTLSCLPLAFLPERNGERSLGSPRPWLLIIYHRSGKLCVATTSQFWGFQRRRPVFCQVTTILRGDSATLCRSSVDLLRDTWQAAWSGHYAIVGIYRAKGQ